MSTITRDQVFQSLTAAVTPDSADHLFRQALQATGLADKPRYTPDEVLSLSHAMLDVAMQLADDAEQQAIYGELFGGDETSS